MSEGLFLFNEAQLEALLERTARLTAGILLAELDQRDDAPPDKLLTADEACTRLSISRTTLWHLRRRGTIAPVYLGRAVRFRASDVDALVETRGSALAA